MVRLHATPFLKREWDFVFRGKRNVEIKVACPLFIIYDKVLLVVQYSYFPLFEGSETNITRNPLYDSRIHLSFRSRDIKFASSNI